MISLPMNIITKERRAAATIALFPVLLSAEQRFTYAATTTKHLLPDSSIDGCTRCTLCAVSATATPVIAGTPKSHSVGISKFCGRRLRARAEEEATVRQLLMREWQQLQRLDAERSRHCNKFGCRSRGFSTFFTSSLNVPLPVKPADPFTNSVLGLAKDSKPLISAAAMRNAAAQAAVRQVAHQRQEHQQLLQQSLHNAGHKNPIEADDEEGRSRKPAASLVSDPSILQCAAAAAETSAQTLQSQHSPQQQQLDPLSQAGHKLLTDNSSDVDLLDCNKSPEKSSLAANSFSGSGRSRCEAVKGSSDTGNFEGSSSTNATEEQVTDREKTKKWRIGNLLLAAAGATIATAYSWLLVHCDFNIAKTEWLLREMLCRALLRHERGEKRDAQDRSRFEVGLSEDLQKEIALYFLQLDLDKPNGVRRSDAISLVEEVGEVTRYKLQPTKQLEVKLAKLFSTLEAVALCCYMLLMLHFPVVLLPQILFQLHLMNTWKLDAKRVSGVTLQDFAALLEQILIEEELSATVAVPAAASAAAGATTKTEAQPHSEVAAANTKKKVNAGATGVAAVSISGPSEGDDSLLTKSDGKEQKEQQQQKSETNEGGDPRERLLRYLREANRSTVTAATIPTCYTERELMKEEKRASFFFTDNSIPASLPAINQQQPLQLPEPLSQQQLSHEQEQSQKNEQSCVESEQQALFLQAERLERTARDMHALAKRRRLSEAEAARLAGIEERLKRVKHDLWSLEKSGKNQNLI